MGVPIYSLCLPLLTSSSLSLSLLQGAGGADPADTAESGGSRERAGELSGTAFRDGGRTAADAGLTGAGQGAGGEVHPRREGGRGEEGQGGHRGVFIQKVTIMIWCIIIMLCTRICIMHE